MSGPVLSQVAGAQPQTSDPLKTFVEGAKELAGAVEAGTKQGQSDANEVLNAIGLGPKPAEDDKAAKKDAGVVVLVIGGLLLVGAAAVVVYVVRRAR